MFTPINFRFGVRNWMSDFDLDREWPIAAPCNQVGPDWTKRGFYLDAVNSHYLGSSRSHAFGVLWIKRECDGRR